MATDLLGNYIIRKSDGKKVAYIGVVPMMDKKTMQEYMRVYPKSKYFWVEYRKKYSPKTSQSFYKTKGGKRRK